MERLRIVNSIRRYILANKSEREMRMMTTLNMSIFYTYVYIVLITIFIT